VRRGAPRRRAAGSPAISRASWQVHGEVVLAARELQVDRRGAPVLRGADLVVRAGEVVAVVGPNGTGKSTLLGALGGDLAPAAGEVLVAGEPVRAWPAAELARRRAVLPQDVSMAFPFTVDQVVRMGRAPWIGTGSADADADAVARAMEACDVTSLRDRPFPALSGGEQARVSLARVLAQGTQLLLLDEPTAALDVRHQQQAFAELRRRADAGAAVVVVLHDLTAASANADRVVLLDAGRVAADGPPREVLRPDLLARVYRHGIDVFPHPTTGAPVVVPLPAWPCAAAGDEPAADLRCALPTGAP
jgi:iron complex transport system ATP-binding protein